MKSKALLLVAIASFAVILAGCSGPLNTPLVQLSSPDKAAAVQEKLTSEDWAALSYYRQEHAERGDLDPTMSVKEALKARKAEMAKEAQLKKNMDSIK